MERLDLVIRNGAVVDGSGGQRFRADVGVRGDRIVRVGDLSAARAAGDIDATSRVVTPGFIDVHTHDDYALLSIPDMAPKVSQGVTTVVVGNCGISLAPLVLAERPPPPLDFLGGGEGFRFPRFADYVAAVEESPPAVNAGLLVGHITLRLGAMRELDRPANGDELAVLRGRVREAMAAGAIGLSTGLDYGQCIAASTDELVALSEEVAASGGIYATHARDFFDHVGDAVEEALEIGRRARLPVVLSHHKVVGPANVGRSRETLARIARARETQPVGLDCYPYDASSLMLKPERCAEPGLRVLITWSHPHPHAAGRELSAVAAEWGCTPRAAAERLVPAGAVYFELDEGDVRRILAHPLTMIGSDGLPHDAHPHPRLWGAFPRVLGHYVRDVGLLTLEEAVHKMTGLAADTLGFAGRGAVREGAFADLVVLDPETVADRGTYDDPVRLAAGIDAVVVNGEIAWRDGKSTGARPGRVLRRERPARTAP